MKTESERTGCHPHDDLTEQTLRDGLFVCVACGSPIGIEQPPCIPPEKGVIYNSGGKPVRPCPIHQRPIHPGTLTKVIYVREQRDRQHRDHYMPEAGCPLCLPSANEGGA